MQTIKINMYLDPFMTNAPLWVFRHINYFYQPHSGSLGVNPIGGGNAAVGARRPNESYHRGPCLANTDLRDGVGRPTTTSDVFWTVSARPPKAVIPS